MKVIQGFKDYFALLEIIPVFVKAGLFLRI